MKNTEEIVSRILCEGNNYIGSYELARTIPSGVSGQSWFLCSNIESSRRMGYVKVEGTRYKKGAEAGTM